MRINVIDIYLFSPFFYTLFSPLSSLLPLKLVFTQRDGFLNRFGKKLTPRGGQESINAFDKLFPKNKMVDTSAQLKICFKFHVWVTNGKFLGCQRR